MLLLVMGNSLPLGLSGHPAIILAHSNERFLKNCLLHSKCFGTWSQFEKQGHRMLVFLAIGSPANQQNTL